MHTNLNLRKVSSIHVFEKMVRLKLHPTIIIIDKEHQKIIGTLYLKIEKLENDNAEMANIEKQHKYLNGELHKEIGNLKAKIKELTNQNTIFKQHLQVKVLKSNKT